MLGRGREVAFSGLFSERITEHVPRQEPFQSDGAAGGGGGLSTCSQSLFSTLLAGSHFAEEKNRKQHRAGRQLSQLNKGQAWPLPKGSTDFLCFCNVFSCPSSPHPCSPCYDTLLVQTVATKSASQSLLDLSLICEGETTLTSHR